VQGREDLSSLRLADCLAQWAWTFETVFEKPTILSRVSILDLLAGMRKGNGVLLANRRFQCCPVLLYPLAFLDLL
jgi:hypothetical protein